MNRKLLVTTISSLLAVAAGPNLVVAQEQATTADTAQTGTEVEKEKLRAAEVERQRIVELQKVVVTGSRIPQAQRESASPVTTITAQEIQAQGYRNVADVLRAQPLATGAVQDNQFTLGFTPGATTISLLGLAPGFTLILIDGRPLADYPLLYNGQSNFTDLSSIPTAMVERIDILPGNQSAIYGSSAIAGVVNIILKTHLEGTQLSLRVGAYQEGGGDNARFQLTGGQTWDKLDVTYGLQVSRQKPIWGYQRHWYDSTEDNPDPEAPFGSRTFLILDGYTSAYIDPGAGACTPLAGNFGGTTIYDFRPDPSASGLFGHYCGSRAEPGYSTVLNQENGVSAYINATFKFRDNAELYASLLLGENRTETNTGSRFWQPDINGSGGYIVEWDGSCDYTLGECPLNFYQHIFSPEETGGADNYTTKARFYNAALGIRGTFGESTWDYDAYYSRSQYRLQDKQLWPLAADIEEFFREQFLGPQLDPTGNGTGTYYGYPVYAPDHAAFYQSLTPTQYRSLLDEVRADSRSWTQTVNFSVTNTDLFELPAGAMGMAALVQVGAQYWDNPTDPRVIEGGFWGITGTQGGGKRNSAAAAVEFRVPLLSKLTANLSARYDRYSNQGGGSDAKATYKLGLEFRPLDTLLIRGNYATAFRAPDMAAVFAGDSGFFTVVTDYFRCEEFHQPPDNCFFSQTQIQGRRIGVPDLKSITATSFGYGVVWSPNRKFDIRADYYHVNIKDEVTDLSLNGILFNENECRRGRLDIGAPTCVDALARIDRNPPTALGVPNLLRRVRTQPINASSEKVSGIVAGTSYRWGGGRNGNFEASLDYNLTFDHRFTQFAGDAELDLLHDPSQSSEFKSVLSGDFVWDIGRWTTTVHGTRYGATPNCAASGPVLGCFSTAGSAPGTIAPHLLFNLNLNFGLTDNSDLTLTVNNVGNRRPARDESFGSYPYYNVFNYNGYGRAFWLQYSLKLD